MEEENLFTKNCIRTYTGKYLNVKDPQPDQIDIVDIAVGLSRVPRFAAHSKKHLRVAQHCIYMSKMVSDDHKMAALLHDASEAYLGDVPGPAKKFMPGYRKVEDRIMRVIAEKYGFQYPLHDEVREADREMLRFEWETRVLRHQPGNMTEKQAKKLFLERFFELLTI